MKYFLDTEFLEGKQDKRFLGFKYGETKPTIDLISIGLVAEDGREYCAVSKGFNLYEAWNRYDLVWEQSSGDMRNIFSEGRNRKVYWIRENVLRPIFNDLVEKYAQLEHKANELRTTSGYNPPYKFDYKTFKKLLSLFGKSNNQIAEEVFQFCTQDSLSIEKARHYNISYENIDLYTYYGAYDHVVFCWLFGKMIDLPKGFPMYSKDLKQELDNTQKELDGVWLKGDQLKQHPDYPKQENEHNALADARWNKKLFEFLNML